MKWGIEPKRPPEVVTITKETPSRKKLDSLIVVKRATLLVLSVMAMVLSINTVANITTSHAVSLYATSDVYIVRAGGKVDLPIPEKFDHTFIGWYRDPAFKKTQPYTQISSATTTQ